MTRRDCIIAAVFIAILWGMTVHLAVQAGRIVGKNEGIAWMVANQPKSE